MNREKVESYFLLALILCILGISFFILKPFLNAIIVAAITAVVFHPLYEALRTRMGNKKGVASLATVTLLTIFIITPLFFIGIRISYEAEGLYTALTSDTARDTLSVFVHSATEYIERYSTAITPDNLPKDINTWLTDVLKWVVARLGTIFSSVVKVFVNLFIFFIALYYFLKDGKSLVQELVIVSPLADSDDRTILRKLTIAIKSSISGSLAIGVIQGVIAGIGFTLFGIPNPVLWGTVVALAALIPGIGTALVLIPAIGFLFFTGHVNQSIGLLVWGAVAVGLIDNLLGPHLIGRNTELPPLFTFLSVIGGILFFGPLGFLLGPITLNLLFALLEIYSRPLRNETSS